MRSNGCLETVVRETMSPRVLWHLKCPIFMLIFRNGGDFFVRVPFYFSVSFFFLNKQIDGDKHTLDGPSK